MIYGKLWCVVRPQFGLPLMIGAVALGSFSVRYALLTHTTWLSQNPNGGMTAAPAAKAAAVATDTLVAKAPAAELK